jgi:hypothetical protein
LTATLDPTPVRLGPGAELVISGQASKNGYSFTLAGQASAAQLASVTHAFPQFADDTGLIVPNSPAADTIHPVALACTRVLGGGQSCSAPVPVPRHPARRNVRLHR